MIKNNSKNKFNNAFTMAEILIVMVVLGLIMSLLVRTIIRTDPDKDKVLFIKAYNAVEQIIANSINDSSKYDQNVYSQTELENWEGDKHFNFAYKPIDDVVINYISNGERKSACKPKGSCDNAITQANAPCYYLVEYMNTIGSVSCEPTTTTTMNFKNSVGVCFWNWNASAIENEKKSYFEAVIDPSCSRKSGPGKGPGYAVRVYSSGVMSVPETSDFTVDIAQKKAVEWIKSPTTYK